MRDNVIDISKGIGIFLVVWGHTFYGPDCITYFHMPLFFVLSGFYFRVLPWNLFFQKRAKRLLIPYMVFFCFCNLCEMALCFITHNEYDIVQRFSHFYQTNWLDGPLWFLLALFWMLLFANAIFKAFQSETLRATFCVVLSLIGYCMTKDEFYIPTYMTQGLRSMVFFYMGYFMNNITICPQIKTPYEYICSLNNRRLMLFAILGGLVLSFGEIAQYPSVSGWYRYYPAAVGGVNMTLALSLLLARTEVLNSLSDRLIEWGMHSLGIMALHCCVLVAIVMVVTQGVKFVVISNSVLLYVIYFIVAVFATLVTCSFIKHITYSRWAWVLGE